MICRAVLMAKDVAMSRLGACRLPCTLKFRRTEFNDSHLNINGLKVHTYIYNMTYSHAIAWPACTYTFRCCSLMGAHSPTSSLEDATVDAPSVSGAFPELAV
jgi:hypothetical protein